MVLELVSAPVSPRETVVNSRVFRVAARSNMYSYNSLYSLHWWQLSTASLISVDCNGCHVTAAWQTGSWLVTDRPV